MGRDRTSTIVTKNGFKISIDKDHLGRYRGNQAVIKKNGKFQYRGWHYHVEHPIMTQIEIMELIEQYLLKISAKKIDFSKNPSYQICIGNVEYTPKKLIGYVLDEKTAILWISSFNGKLHIESNKCNPYAKGIFTKSNLIQVIETIKIPKNLIYYTITTHI